MEPHLDWLTGTRKRVKKLVDPAEIKPMNEAVLGTFEDILVFQKQGNRHQWHDLPFRHQPQNSVSGPGPASQGRDDHRGIQYHALHMVCDITLLEICHAVLRVNQP